MQIKHILSVLSALDPNAAITFSGQDQMVLDRDETNHDLFNLRPLSTPVRSAIDPALPNTGSRGFMPRSIRVGLGERRKLRPE